MTKNEIADEIESRLGIDVKEVRIYNGRYFAIEPTPITYGYWVHEIFIKGLEIDFRIMNEVSSMKEVEEYFRATFG
ncbi:MAG: hypothetical protein Unbinned221contig1000_5 [Prokaryotic dsDNA virus sp.]|nr:MAG: hypothetical protein Unbinned221contig1000_5 [Prokaryotic dsDNA virus sp.]|tara:strand:+ start:1262 stop:1489 length:228 start_codon:yes stop_codon:yes gene_type:complete